MVDQTGRKWIAREIEKLDPHKDFAEIVKLSVIYRANDAFMDLVYAITFPNFITGNDGARAVTRYGRGKLIRHMERRMDDTSRHILIWCEYGPDHEYTKRSIESINQLHKFWSKHHKEGFDHDEDYTYVICYEVTLFHRLMQRVGAKGFSDSEKIASYEFYRRIAAHFRNPLTDAPIEFPVKSFDECMDYVQRYENIKRAPNKHKDFIEEYALGSFGKRHFPPLLRPMSRALIHSLTPEGTLANLRTKPVSPLGKAISRFAFRAFLWLGENAIPDPKVSLPERIRERDGLSEEQYIAAVARGMDTQPKAEIGNAEQGQAAPITAH